VLHYTKLEKQAGDKHSSLLDLCISYKDYILLNVILLCVIQLNVILWCIILLNVILLNVILLSVILLNVILLSVILLR
jgi:hypothetical protein